MTYITDGSYPAFILENQSQDLRDSAKRSFRAKCKRFTVKDASLFYNDRRVVKSEDVDNLLRFTHQQVAKHFGVNKTLHLLKQNY